MSRGNLLALMVMADTPKLSGRASLYRGKIRSRPVVLTLTPDGHEGLAAGSEREKLSKPDYIEDLIRKDNKMKRLKRPSSSE